MQFYPHNIASNLAGSAISASKALTGSFVNNFADITILVVNTASIGLNIKGTNGTDGTSVAVYGPKGDQGTRGVTGFKGNNILLLSSSWSASNCYAGSNCYGGVSGFTLYNVGPGTLECNTNQGSGQFWSNGNSTAIYNTLVGEADGFILYITSDCTKTARNRTSPPLHNGQGVVFYTDGSGQISTVGCNS